MHTRLVAGKTRSRKVATHGTHEVELQSQLDELTSRLRVIDAYASAADAAIDAIPYVADPERRRQLDHLVEFVTATAKAARAALDIVKPTAIRERTVP